MQPNRVNNLFQVLRVLFFFVHQIGIAIESTIKRAGRFAKIPTCCYFVFSLTQTEMVYLKIKHVMRY